MARLVTVGRDEVGLAALVTSVVAALPLLPDAPWRHLAEPPYQAFLALIATTAVILVQRALGRRGSTFERRLLALFLAGMPLVYVADLAVAGPVRSTGWLAVELGGLVAFGALAALGVRKSSRFIAGGIVAHGIAWDAWHHGLAIVPDWYATGCLIADLGVGFYAITQVRALDGLEPGDLK